MCRNVSQQAKINNIYGTHKKKYSYGHRTKHNIATLLGSDMAAQKTINFHHRSKYYQLHDVEAYKNWHQIFL
jgi:hypothetical protein